MKKTILSILTLAAAFALGSLRASDIYDVHACKADGTSIIGGKSEYTIDTPMIPGKTAYFKVRFLAQLEDGAYSTNKWSFEQKTWSVGSTNLVLAPQIGIYVSGELRYATYIGKLHTGNYFTDLVFAYQVQPGDYALPIVLAAKDADGNPVPASDRRESISSYYLHPLRETEWELRFPMYDGSYSVADWSVMQKAPVPMGGASVDRPLDVSLEKANYCVRTIGFDDDWQELKTLWRSVHEGSDVIDGGMPPARLVAESAPVNAVTLHVWSTNEDVVVVSGEGVREVEMVDPADPTKTKTYHVADITFAAGQTIPSTFTIRGVSKDVAGGRAGLVLSANDHFRKSDATGYFITDFITVPVQCTEPLPPSVLVEADTTSAVAGYDYLTAAAQLTVRLSDKELAKTIEPFTVTVTPSLSDGTDISDPAAWGQYVRFSTDQRTAAVLPDATLPTVTLGGGVESAVVYVFCLRGDTHTSTLVNKMVFTPSAVPAPPEITRWTAGAFNIVAQVPEVTQPPASPVFTFEAQQYTETPMEIRVEGSYADAASDAGYQVWVKYTPTTKFVQIPGLFKPGEGNVLYKVGTTDEMPMLTYSTTSTADKPVKSQLYVVAPVSGKSSAPGAAYRDFDAVVRKQTESYVTTADGKSVYQEGARVTFQISLSEPYDDDEIYAFLMPSDNITDFKIFSGSTPFIVGMENCKGIRIGKGKGVEAPVKGTIQMLDGWNPDDGGLNFSVSVVLRDRQRWDDPDAKTIAGYGCDELELTVENVEPEITRVELNGMEPDEDHTFDFSLPKGQVQTLTAKVKDVSYDLENTDEPFQCKWTVYRNNKQVKAEIVEGNPDDNPFKYNFPQSGSYKIRLQVMDKDMWDWCEDDYEVFVEVLDNPSVTVTAQEFYQETDGKAYVDFGLTYFDAEVPLHAEIVVKPVKTTIDDGVFELETNRVTFANGDSQTIRVSAMDGTAASSLNGFEITARITDETINPQTGERWCDYYLPGKARVFVENVNPNNGDEERSFSPDANTTNAWEVAGGSASQYPLSFFIRTDVDRDFAFSHEKWPTAGIKVTIMGGGGETYNEDGFVNGVKYFTEPGSGKFIPDFGSAQGPQSVTITIEDKDTEQPLSRTWKFNVAPSKYLRTIANGPSGGTTSSALSQKYAGASGIGQGHVWVGENGEKFASANDFRLRWNCSKNTTSALYAWGYKVGAVDDGSLDAHDQPIGENGNAQAGVTPENPFRYKDPVKDSFLYAWILNTTGEDGKTESSILGTLSPERSAGEGPGVGEVMLPTEQNEDGTYLDTTVEAIFSKEFLASDNMGDINQDGIPDLYVTKYKFDVIDETTGALAEDGKDLKSLRAYNADVDKDGAASPDYLPNFTAGGQLDRAEFTAVLEIRGYGDGLNDAPALAGITGVKPDRIYAEEIDDGAGGTTWKWTPKCSISELEFAAWTEYAAATWPDDPEAWTKAANWEKWSPERPSDPTMDDTDGDGFTDGFEYYFWYRAHVGDPDVFKATGRHVRLTGRKYDPKNPGEGVLITAEEIEAAFDPLVANGNGETARLADTDNDGLPDYLEFLIGTNPLDFDTDGDGLPDGWEVMISGTDPLKAYTTPGICDAMRNYDGDAMAFTTPRLESGVKPKPFVTVKPTTFALVQAGGMTDGIQWYASEAPLAAGALAFEETTFAGTVFTAGGQLYVTTNSLPVTAGGILAATLGKTAAWTALDLTKKDDVQKLTDLGLEVPEGVDCVRLMPTYVPAGTPVSAVEGEKTCATLVLSEKVTGTQAAWVYGSVKVPTLTTGQTSANKGGFGMLALGKYLDAPAKTPLAALPKEDADIAYLHYLVYQQFGFDPRTAWNANTPLNARWGKTADGEAKADGLGSGNGYAGQATRTREYTAYDEFLVYSFFVNNGMKTFMYKELGDEAPEMAELWYANTTNPQGPNEPDIDTDGVADKATDGEKDDALAAAQYWGRNSDSGADTDLDGVPDGWELYVMSGPKKGGKFVFPAPYDDVPYSSFSPFVPDAKKTSATDNKDLEDGAAGDADNLTEYQEFEGTDTMAWYRTVAPATPTIVHDATWTWFNKFFPTDPWNDDTDGDGLKDNENSSKDQLQAFSRCANFTYADVDTGKTCIPGGGLNPCSVDTDQDGLPDAWEAQFAGTKESVYTGAECQYASGTDAEGNEKTSTTQTLQGLADGMDGTVKDAYNYVRINRTTDSGTTSLLVSVNGVNQVVDRDYDHDGLDNWQEYLVGTMRCWRYDDPVSPWISIPTAYYFDEDGVFNPFRDGPDGEENYYLKLLGITSGTEEEFWYRTLFDKTSKAYNPHLVTDSSSSSLYFSRVTNGFDPNFTDKGSYYVFHDRINADELLNLWGGAPVKYVSCSPVKADTDGDGMDDYYELFHGLNPLLGAAGVRSGGDMCDIVFDAWSTSTVDAPITALKNVWTLNAKSLLGREPRTNDPENNKFDFELFPWLNGLALADADGDDIRNCDEAIMPMIAPQATWRHTDPSSLWFTDSSYTNSLVNRFYRLPATYADITLPYETFTYKDQTYSFTEADGYYVDASGLRHLAPFTADWWKLTSASSQNYMFSFEENEGYDTDHDGISDFEELQGRPTGTVSDPQEADSPYRRQAMYFPGDKAALQSMPFVKEGHPRYGYGYPDDMSFVQYTVECWVRPEEADPAKSYTVLERAIWADYSAAGDEKLLRKNFQLAIRQGCWYTKFDANGTLEDSVVELQSTKAAELGTWTHLAATYDGSVLRLYVNGSEVNKTGVSGRGLKPEYGSSAVVVHPGEGLATTNGMYLGRADTYWYDREYALHAFIVGASAQSLHVTNGVHNSHLNVMNGRGWDRYEDFFKGYVDEIRIWDGARAPADIAADRMRRYTADDVKANRAAFYDQWASGKFRYGKDGNGKDYDVIPELRYHWSFDSLPAAENPAMAAKSAHGYGYAVLNENLPSGVETHAGSKAPLARPIGYEISWWKRVLEGYTGTVYCNPAYITWIPNTVTHLPRFDSTTLDSQYWAKDTEGVTPGTFSFQQTAEPVSLWTQVQRQGPFTAASDGDYVDFKTTERRFWQANVDANNNLSTLFEFTGRHLNQKGDDLLPLGGAYVKYVSEMWDGQGASTASEITGTDENNNGLADWWEKYAAELVDGQPRYLPEDDPMTWGTFVTYSNGRRMTAGEAYLLDLAKGLYADENGNIVTDPAKTRQYRDTVDEDGDGLPDNWEKRYGIHTGDRVPADSAGHAKEDPDHDGLPNAVEYLLSEVFDFQGLVFDPTKACSVDEHTLDYFFRVGELYVGEIFTDHDLVDDSWENLYEKDYASILNWDALRDFDGDGWSNRSENRYSNLVMPIVADKISHYTAADGLVADYPIPTLKLTLRYNGNRQDTVSAAPVVVQVTQDAGYTKDPDATFSIGAAEAKADTGKDSKSNDSTATASAETAKTRTIGKWSNRHAIGTLTPGNIKQNSLALEFCYDPSSVVYSWDVQLVHIGGSVEVQTKRGTRAEYDADKRRYGEANVKLISADTSYAQLKDLEIRANAQSSEATWIHTKSGKTLGTVNLVTGEFDLNLGVFEGQYVENGTNGTDIVSLEDQTFRITYTANASVGLPRELYLGAADKGRIKEGRNTVVAWADLDGDGKWTAGEPYGIRRNVDVSWKGTSAEIELTDESPVTARIILPTGDSDRLDDTREAAVARVAKNTKNDPTILAYISTNAVIDGTITDNDYHKQRIRVVRWMINDVPTYLAGAEARVVLDKKIETDVRSTLTEADFLHGTDAFDLDWEHLREEVTDNAVVQSHCGANITNVTYLIVVGDGPVTWNKVYSNDLVTAIQPLIVRRFTSSWVKPTPIAPGASTEEIVTVANPTFTWKMNCPADEGFTAFRIKVSNSDGKLVYDSGPQDAPPLADGRYSWKAPLFVGDKTTAGAVFANKARYSWNVTMYNAKYSNTSLNYGSSGAGTFYLNVETNGTEYGTANVAVRYFGPTDSWAKKNPVVRVRAYTSPDFTGTPVAAGYVADPANAENGLVVTGREVTANCRVIGIPAGTYYLQAFIDSNGNGTCDPWESSGYLCSRSLKTPTADYLDPMAMTFGDKLGEGDLAVIYLEDADTDNDGLPDAWEYALYGNLTTKGVESLTETKAGESLYSKDLAGKELSLQADPILSLGGLAGQVGSRFLSSAGMLALAMSAPIAGDEPFAAAISRVVEPELAEGGVKITALEISGGTVTIALDIETTAANTESSLAKYFDANGDLNVTCKVLWTPTLANEPTVVATKKVTVGKGAVTLEITDENVLSSPSGFFSVSVEKE